MPGNCPFHTAFHKSKAPAQIHWQMPPSSHRAGFAVRLHRLLQRTSYSHAL